MHVFPEEEREMGMIGRWFRAARERDPRDSDPYLESLVRQLLLLRSGQRPRRATYPGPARP